MTESYTQVDVIIVGQGLAGTALAWELQRCGRSFVIVDDAAPHSSSRIAAGLITPVVGKRLTQATHYAKRLQIAADSYAGMEQATGVTCWLQQPALRVFRHADERAVFAKRSRDAVFAAAVSPWPVAASARDGANDDLQADRQHTIPPEELNAPFGGFLMHDAARLRTGAYLRASREYFQRRQQVIETCLPLDSIQWQSHRVAIPHLSLTASRLVFCEGFVGRDNPLFGHVVFEASRGDILTVRIPTAGLNRVVHKDLWLVPTATAEKFLAGSTYDADFTHTIPSEHARDDIAGRLRELIRLPFDIIDHQAAVRPIVKGRQPVIGALADCPEAVIFNGLGSHGSLLAPGLARELVAHLFDSGGTLSADFDVNRRFPRVKKHRARNNPRPRLTTQAQSWLAPQLRAGDIAIDATAGNGHDTLFLSQQVAPDGHVFAFDIQQRALDLTADRLAAAGQANWTPINCSHATLRDEIPPQFRGHVSAVMFNLGYLPGGDKRLMTQADSTRAALQSAFQLLRIGGMMTVLAYPLHPGGAAETQAVAAWMDSIQAELGTVRIANPDRPQNAPVLYFVTRTAEPLPQPQDDSVPNSP